MRSFHSTGSFLRCFFFGVHFTHVADDFGEEEKNFSGFKKFYNEKIRPKALRLEQIRFKALRRLIWISRFLALVLALIWGSAFYLTTHDLIPVNSAQEDIVGFLVAVSFLLLGWPVLIAKDFSLEIKENFFSEIFQFCNFHYYPEGSKLIADYQSFGILPKYEMSHSSTEDLVIGTYKDVNFYLEELKLQVEESKKDDVVTTFEGIVIKLSFNKSFGGRTILKSNLGKVRNFSRKIFENNLKDMEKVELEDLEFEKIFEVFSTDQIEARYLLTTSFMERLKNIGSFFGAKKIEGSFAQNALLLTFADTLNLFEAESIFEPVNVALQSRYILQEIGLIYDLIEVLKLDERTGL